MPSARTLLSLSLALLSAASLATAQDALPPLPAPPAPPALPHGGRSVDRRVVVHSGSDEPASMGIVPPGTWWRDPDTVKQLSLGTDQARRMDEIFRQNRIQLVDMKAMLEKEQINLEPLLNANPPDSTKALAEISKIADLRADLEKANARMLLSLRAVLSSDQWTKLQENHFGQPFLHFNMKTGSGDHRQTTTICTQADGQTKPTCTTTHSAGKGPSGPSALLGPTEDLDLNLDGIPDLDGLSALTSERLSAQLARLRSMPPIHIPAMHIPAFDLPEHDIPAIHMPAIDIPARDFTPGK